MALGPFYLKLGIRPSCTVDRSTVRKSVYTLVAALRALRFNPARLPQTRMLKAKLNYKNDPKNVQKLWHAQNVNIYKTARNISFGVMDTTNSEKINTLTMILT